MLADGIPFAVARVLRISTQIFAFLSNSTDVSGPARAPERVDNPVRVGALNSAQLRRPSTLLEHAYTPDPDSPALPQP